MVKESFYIHGHENIRSTHKSTIEFTKEKGLSTKGDCIIGIDCKKGCKDISGKVREAIRDFESRIRITISADTESGYVEDIVHGSGHPDLELSDDKDMVIRKSGHISSRTVCIGADKGAKDLDRRLVEHLSTKENMADVKIEVIKHKKPKTKEINMIW